MTEMEKPAKGWFARAVEAEVAKARATHRGVNSLREGYAVILEELDELWDEVKRKAPDRLNVLVELVQLGAMAQRVAEDTELVERFGPVVRSLEGVAAMTEMAKLVEVGAKAIYEADDWEDASDFMKRAYRAQAEIAIRAILPPALTPSDATIEAIRPYMDPYGPTKEALVRVKDARLAEFMGGQDDE